MVPLPSPRSVSLLLFTLTLEVFSQHSRHEARPADCRPQSRHFVQTEFLGKTIIIRLSTIATGLRAHAFTQCCKYINQKGRMTVMGSHGLGSVLSTQGGRRMTVILPSLNTTYAENTFVIAPSFCVTFFRTANRKSMIFAPVILSLH